MRFKKTTGSGILEGDLTPMIDMTFQLIAFFMVLINFSQTEADQNILLPESVLAKPPDHPVEFPITIQLKQDGGVIYGGQELASMQRLRPYLVNERSVLEGRDQVGDATVIIRAHRKAKAGDVQRLMELCQEEKFVKFKLRAKRRSHSNAALSSVQPGKGCCRQRKCRKRFFEHMRIRHVGSSEDKIELQMTPMIDIVFQLLVFFIMTFKIVAQEGDFDIKMPLQQQQQGPDIESPVLTLHVHLRAAPNGDLLTPDGIIVNGELRFSSCDELHNYIIGILGGDEPSAREDAEVELEFDYGLNYENVIDAISAVSGYIDESTGQVEKLIDNINFTPLPSVGGS